MSESDLKSKVLSGMKWTVIISGLSIPLSYILNIIIGRIDPSALGKYSLFQVLMQTLITFILFGGNAVLSNYLPKTNDTQEKKNIIYSYALIIISIITIASLIVLLFPSLLDLNLLSFETNISRLMIYGFSVIYIVSIFFQYVLNGLMEIRLSNLLNKIHLMFLPIILIFIWIIDKNFLGNHSFEIIFFTMLGVSILNVVISIRKVKPNLVKTDEAKKYFPVGFWKFSIFVHLGTLLTYAYNNIDKIFVLQLGEFGQLGIYHAIILVYTFIRFIPQLFINVLIPMFSSYIGTNNQEGIRQTYYKVEIYSILINTVLSLFVVTFSNNILAIFGPEYTEYSNILILFAVATAFGTLSYSNIPLLISSENNKTHFVNSFLQISIQLLLTFLLINSQGMLGVAIAKVIGVILAQVIPTYVVVKKLRFGINVPSHFYKSLILLLIFGGGMLFIEMMIFKIIAFILGVVVFTLWSGYKKEELTYIIKIFLSRKI